MKKIYMIIIALLLVSINVYSQKTRPAHKRARQVKAVKTHTNNVADTLPALQPRVTATERYLNGTAGKNSSDTSALKSTGNQSPFAGGVHAAANAEEKFDTINRDINSTNRGNTAVASATSNDTVFNMNTITDNGMTTNSGAVDRSGQAQFGQTNWGNNRSTVGESQWTVPPPVTASFTKEFPSIGDLTWTRNNTDTSIYSARYRSGDTWVTTNYSVAGQRLDMRTEVPLTLLPQPVSAYIGKLPNNLQISGISKWQVMGKPDVYEIKTRTGKTLYVNIDGAEMNR